MEFFDDDHIKTIGKIALWLIGILVIAIVITTALSHFKIIPSGKNSMPTPTYTPPVF